jgi:hypothetical protein
VARAKRWLGAFLHVLDCVYTVIMLTFWYGLFFQVWTVWGLVVFLWWYHG